MLRHICIQIHKLCIKAVNIKSCNNKYIFFLSFLKSTTEKTQITVNNNKQLFTNK